MLQTVSSTALGYPATQGPAVKSKTDAEVRESYNAAISQKYEEFKSKAAVYHQNEQCFGEELAKEAFDTRHAIKSAHREETSYLAMVAIYARNLYKYGSLQGPTRYEDFRQLGKNPEEIGYSAFKTNGADLGLANNGVGELLDIWSVAQSKGEVSVYPESISQQTVDCIKSQAGEKFTKQDVLAAYDICVAKTPFKLNTTA